MSEFKKFWIDNNFEAHTIAPLELDNRESITECFIEYAALETANKKITELEKMMQTESNNLTFYIKQLIECEAKQSVREKRIAELDALRERDSYIYNENTALQSVNQSLESKLKIAVDALKYYEYDGKPINQRFDEMTGTYYGGRTIFYAAEALTQIKDAE